MAFERLKERIKENRENRDKVQYVATQVYLPPDSADAEIGDAGRWVMANYEALNTDGGYGALQPAGVYVGNDWLPAGIAAGKG